MASLINSPLLNKKVLYVKGAPEIVLSKCNQILTEQGLKDATEYNSLIVNSLTQYQNQAMRTLGFAYEIIEDNIDRFENGKLVNSNLVFLGITAISDPVRLDVPSAVTKCLNAV